MIKFFRIYYFVFIIAGVLIAQDPPEGFEYNQSTNQGFYLFLDINILEQSLSPDDWIGVFNAYDETLGGECLQSEMNFDETLGGMCEGINDCIDGFPNCNPDTDCPSSLDVDGDGQLTECACADINEDGYILSQNLEVSVGARLFGDCLEDTRTPCDIPAMGYDGNCYSSGYLTNGQTPYFKIYDTSEGEYYYAYPTENYDYQSGSFNIINSLSVSYDCADPPILGGQAFYDDCGECSGGTTTHIANSDIDCNGDCAIYTAVGCVDTTGNGTCGDAYIDGCNECVGGNTGLLQCNNDCFGTPGGDADWDSCNICSGGETGLIPNNQQECIESPETFVNFPNLDCNCDCYNPVPDENGIVEIHAELDDCGICSGGLSGHDFNIDMDCSGPLGDNDGDNIDDSCFGDAVELIYCIDSDNDEFGLQGSETEFCDALVEFEEENWVLDCSDLYDDCFSNNVDCSGDCDGLEEILNYCIDTDGDGLGDPNSITEYCSSNVPDSWTEDCTDFNDEIYCESNLIDECGICDGDSSQCQQPVAYPQTIGDEPNLFYEDTSIYIELDAYDPNSDELTYEITSAPLYGSLVEYSNNVFNYIPSSNFNGNDSFNFRVFDGIWYSNVATVSIFVTEVNDYPVLSNIENVFFNEDQSGTLTLNANDVDGDPLFYYIQGGENITAELNENEVVFFSNTNYNGSETFTATVDDGELSDSQSFDVIVNPVNDIPYFTTNLLQDFVDEDLEYILDFNNFVEDIDNEISELSLILTSTPDHGTVSLDSLSISYIPFENINGVFESLIFKIYDGQEVSNDEFNLVLEILPVNDSPTIVSSPIFVATEDVEYQYQVDVADIDSDNFSYVLDFSPIGMSVSDDGLISWIPTEGILSSGEIIITVSDGELSDSQSFEIIVSPVNDPPFVIQNIPDLDIFEGSDDVSLYPLGS